MSENIKRFFSRLKLKFYLWLVKGGNIVKREEEISPYEKTCFMICLKLMKQKNTKLSIAPMSNKRYLENKDLSIFITIADGRINLTNHVYHYDVKLSSRDWERITYVFDSETEKRRLTYEETVNSQIKNSLHSVLEKLSNFKEDSIN
jgi:hypothetical protein